MPVTIKPLSPKAKRSMTVLEMVQAVAHDVNAWLCYNPSRHVYVEAKWQGWGWWKVTAYYVDSFTGSRCTIYYRTKRG
jgi:hypothetical protein